METIDSKTTIGQLASAFYNAITKEAANNAVRMVTAEDNLIKAEVFNINEVGHPGVKMVLKLSINGKEFIFEGYPEGAGDTRYYLKKDVFITDSLGEKVKTGIMSEIFDVIAKCGKSY